MRFAFLTDLHFGFERRSGHKVPLHDPRAFGATMGFLQDFKPQVLILGGDMLDCGVISHHNHGKPGRTEGLRLLADAEECRQEVLKPLEQLRASKQVYITGNHEDWLTDLSDGHPGLAGLVDLERILALKQWQLVPQGGHFSLGKLTFIHGDQVKGGEHVAKAAVISYERSVRFGHHHTYQVYTKTSALDIKLGRTGIAVPCLCTKDPKYGEGAPNRWVQGLNWGYVNGDGTYADYVSVITNGKLIGPDGKVYRG
jgi:hypothetical protein